MSLAGRLAIVVITRDRREELLRTLGELAALPEPVRTVLVDNASSDGTVEAVRERFPAVEVVALARNDGAAARNVGVARLDEPYVAFCDDDSWWQPGALEGAVALLDDHPRLALVQGHVLVGPDERDDPTCIEMAHSPLPAREGQPGHALLSFVCCAVVMRRAAFEEAGGFSLRLRIGGEEEIMGHDLAARGWLQSYVPELRAHHHPSKVRDAHGRREVGIRNTLWTTWLRRPAGPAARRTIAVLRRLPRDRVSARGVGQALAGLPWVLRERAPSPPHVEAMQAALEDQQLNSGTRRYVS
ncbi:MAG: glycosyltransferase [Actinomycetota bacterium]|nr:glycosyltransferase [Actinomycetota bacterium]